MSAYGRSADHSATGITRYAGHRTIAVTTCVRRVVEIPVRAIRGKPGAIPADPVESPAALLDVADFNKATVG
jgi:hypothetical protein